MELPIVYRWNDISSVKVGIIKIKIIKLLSPSKMAESKEDIPFQMLSSFCDIPIEKIKGISMLDANRIIFQAWRNTHGEDIYLAKETCECGKLVLIKHELNCKYERVNIYDSKLITTTKNEDLKDFELKIELQPLGFDLFSKMFSENSVVIEDALIYGHIKSVNDNVLYNKDEISIKVYNQISDLVEKDIKYINDMCEAEAKCVCGKTVSSHIGWHNARFLQGK